MASGSGSWRRLLSASGLVSKWGLPYDFMQLWGWGVAQPQW